MAGGCQGGGSTRCATFKIQSVEEENLRVFIGIVKGGAELKIFRFMLKYNDLFVTQNLSGNVIAFMGGRPLEGRPWIFNIPRDKPTGYGLYLEAWCIRHSNARSSRNESQEG